jgi:hypothetical protein
VGASAFADQALVNAPQERRGHAASIFAQEQIMPLAGSETKNRTFMQ